MTQDERIAARLNGPALIAQADAQFPEFFKLRAFPGKRFRINLSASYISEGQVVLYTDVESQDGAWLAFAKGSPAELQAEVVAEPKPTTCPIRVGEVFHRHACGRAVPAGFAKCKLHLDHDRRAAERHAKWEAERQAQKAQADVLDGIATALHGLLDGQVTVGYNSRGQITLTPQAAELIIAKL